MRNRTCASKNNKRKQQRISKNRTHQHGLIPKTSHILACQEEIAQSKDETKARAHQDGHGQNHGRQVRIDQSFMLCTSVVSRQRCFCCRSRLSILGMFAALHLSDTGLFIARNGHVNAGSVDYSSNDPLKFSSTVLYYMFVLVMMMSCEL